jgi:hypothetical protein
MKNEKCVCVLLCDTMHAQTNRSSGANKSLPHIRYMHLRKEMLTRSVLSVPSSPFSLPDPVSITVVVVQDSVTMFLNITIFIPQVQMLKRMQIKRKRSTEGLKEWMLKTMHAGAYNLSEG